MREIYDVGIGGGGIVANWIAYLLSFTNCTAWLLEKYGDVALVNSNTDQNAQSLHGGPEETNFGFTKVMMMRLCEIIQGAFLETFCEEGEGKTFMHLPKMALAVGQSEVMALFNRFTLLKDYFPGLEFLTREDLLKREPALIEGRDLKVPVAAMGRRKGFAVDYHKVAKTLMYETLRTTKNILFKFNTEIIEIIKHKDHFEVITNNGTYRCRVFIACTGAYSLKYAQDFDAKDKDGANAKDFIALPVAGSFYRTLETPRLLNSKVYPMQDPKFPFARPHADPAIHDPSILRFGPTAKWIPMMERYHWKTFIDYLRSGILTPAGVIASFALLKDPDMIKFMLKNRFYDFPVLGKRSFLKRAAQHIIPTLSLDNLEFIPGDGGLRPQLLNVRTCQLQMGTGKFFAENFIANHTPSPGASSSGYSGILDVRYAVKSLGPKYWFDEASFYEEIRLKNFNPNDVK